MYIKDDEINRIFNEKNWKIAHSYYKDNVITNMSVLKQENEYHIDGTVEIYGRSSTCHIVVDTGGKINNFECDCPYCHNDELACGHIGVLLLKFYSFTEEMKKLGKNPSSKILSFDLIRADNKISEKLKVEENSLVYKIVRLRIADEVPMMVECTYLPEYRFIDLKEKMLKEKPMYDIFREVYNVSLTKAKESFKPILISKSDSKLLNVEDGTAAMRIERVTFENERVIEYT